MHGYICIIHRKASRRYSICDKNGGRFPPDGESAPHTVSAKTNQRRHRRRVKGAMLEGWQAAGAARGRAVSGDPSSLPASAALMMATVTGARAQGRSAQCGMLEEGLDADIAVDRCRT